MNNIMRSRNANMKVKRKVFNKYILPVMTYGSETWALNHAMEETLSVNQRKMERIMLGITLRDRKRNIYRGRRRRHLHQTKQAQMGRTRGKAHRQQLDD